MLYTCTIHKILDLSIDLDKFIEIDDVMRGREGSRPVLIE
jgi:hypothetical protein